MLVLTRKPSERIFIGDDIEVTVVAVSGGRVKLGFVAPADVPIQREELRSGRSKRFRSHSSESSPALAHG